MTRGAAGARRMVGRGARGRARAGGRAHGRARERMAGDAQRISALLAPNALIAAISATTVPAAPPRTGEMASAKIGRAVQQECRDLHSSPTRRASDLDAQRISALLAPNALIAAISATTVPAAPPRTGEMASA